MLTLDSPLSLSHPEAAATGHLQWWWSPHGAGRAMDDAWWPLLKLTRPGKAS